MKWLFFTLVALNLIVFSALLARKIYQPTPQPQTVVQQPAPQQAPNQVIINTGSNAPMTPSTTPLPNSIASTLANANRTPRVVIPRLPSSPINNLPNGKAAPANKNAETTENTTAQVRYRACSARVSLPEDDYHRIKGLLNRFPHAATRQVVEGGGENGEQSSARMNVLFMNVNDQDASAIQSVVGRYGQLNRAPCPQ